MEVLRFDDPAAFAAEVTPFLMRDEARNCFHLGYIPTLTKPTEITLLCARDDRSVLAVATMTPGRQIAISDAPPDAIRSIVQFLITNGTAPPGVQGPVQPTTQFADEWSKQTGKIARTKTRLGIYQLNKVIPPSPVPGAIRIPQPSDTPLVSQWIEEFRIELGEAIRVESSETLAKEKIAKQAIALWHDNEPVAMTGFTGSTPHGMRVILVYTPPRFRKRGYASNVVAALSQRLLDSGKQFCFLYTDLANPTSNKIYQEIGYQPVGENVHIVFDDPPAQ